MIMMHLIFICRGNPLTSTGGTEIFVGNLAIELAKRGILVDVLNEVERIKIDSFANNEQVKFHNLHIINIPYLRTLAFRRKCTKECVKLLQESKIDAIIAFGAGTFQGYVFDRIKKLKGKTLLVYYAMDSMMMEFQRSKKSSEVTKLSARFKRWIWYSALIKSDKECCINSELIFASSKDTANHLIADYGVPITKINLLYEGIPEDFAVGYDAIDPRIPTFLHVAGGPRKGTDFFLKAIKLLKDKYGLTAKVVILRASRSNIEQAETLGVEVDAYRYVKMPELKRQYASCTAFVSPSLSEGFCLPIIEAAMFEKPSVVTNIGSLPELVRNGENGFVIPVADVGTLAHRLHQIAINAELRRKMGKNARKCSENFTISRTATNLLKLIEEMQH
jgi:glycosyltransferase involved in cell wall biosynthesis